MHGYTGVHRGAWVHRGTQRCMGTQGYTEVHRYTEVHGYTGVHEYSWGYTGYTGIRGTLVHSQVYTGLHTIASLPLVNCCNCPQCIELFCWCLLSAVYQSAESMQEGYLCWHWPVWEWITCCVASIQVYELLLGNSG